METNIKSISIPKSGKGKSLFEKINPKSRKPSNYYPMSKFACI